MEMLYTTLKQMLQTARSTWAKRLARPEITMHFFIIWSILKGTLNYVESNFCVGYV